jgi:hypothetical protein
VGRDPREAAARERQTAMADELRKAELVRDRLEGLNQLVAVRDKATETFPGLSGQGFPRGVKCR